MPKRLIAALSFLAALLPAAAHARTICTIVSDAADGKVLLEQGDCKTRVTPASTTKIAFAVMGFDSGFLKNAHSPLLPYRKGYVAWRKEWKEPTDPARWLKYSVLWYSHVLARELGRQRLERYASQFGFGNADFSGDPGKDNGLERAWISSSLKISPQEQVVFLRRLVNRTLPVAPDVFDKVERTVEKTPLPGGMVVHGKTGTARKPESGADRPGAYGWFVGWAEADGRRLVFARLEESGRKTPGSFGALVRENFLKDLPALAARLPE